MLKQQYAAVNACKPLKWHLFTGRDLRGAAGAQECVSIFSDSITPVAPVRRSKSRSSIARLGQISPPNLATLAAACCSQGLTQSGNTEYEQWTLAAAARCLQNSCGCLFCVVWRACCPLLYSGAFTPVSLTSHSQGSSSQVINYK